MKHAPLAFLAIAIAIAIAIAFVGAGCAKTAPQSVTNSDVVSVPSTNSSVANSGSKPAPAGSKKYTSAPYDFSYPAKYTLTDHPMTDAARKTYLDRGLDAPLQDVNLAAVIRPPGFEGEGPASINVVLWNNANRTPLREWAKKQVNYTNFTPEVEAGGKIGAEAFMGHPSLTYEYDGLYGGKMRLIDLGGTVLEISADFDTDTGNTNMAAFAMILETLTLK